MTILEIIFAMRRRRYLALGVFLFIVASFEWYTQQIPPAYRTYSRVEVDIPPIHSFNILSDTVAERVETEILVRLQGADGAILQAAARSLEPESSSQEIVYLAARIGSATRIDFDEVTSFVTVSVTSNKPAQAVIYANAVARAMVGYPERARREIIETWRTHLSDRREKAKITKPEIERTMELLDLYESMTPTHITFVDPAREPQVPIYPNYKNNRLVGIFFALLLSVAAVCLAESYGPEWARLKKAQERGSAAPPADENLKC